MIWKAVGLWWSDSDRCLYRIGTFWRWELSTAVLPSPLHPFTLLQPQECLVLQREHKICKTAVLQSVSLKRQHLGKFKQSP